MGTWWIALAVAHGADRVVGPSPGADYPDLVTAVQLANSGDRLLLESGTYTGSVDFNNDRFDIESIEPWGAVIRTDSDLGIRVRNGGADVSFRNVVIDGQGQFPAFTVVNNATLTLDWVRVTDTTRGGGNPDGGALRIESDSVATVRHSVFDTSTSTEDGGFVAVYSGAILEVEATEFVGGTASRRGGAIYCTEADVCRFVETTFDGNQATSSNGEGGALWARAVDELTVLRSRLCRGEAERGGALYVSNTDFALQTSLLDANTARDLGGAVYVIDDDGSGVPSADPARIRSLHNVFRSNEADRGGAGLIAGEAARWWGHGDIYRSNQSTTSGGQTDILRGQDDATALIDWNLVFDITGDSFTTFPDDGTDNHVRNLIENEDPLFAGTTVCDPESVRLLTGSPAVSRYDDAPDYTNPGNDVYPSSQLTDLDGSLADLGLWGTQLAIRDADGDGFIGGLEDCDDGAFDVRPGAGEITANGVDEDCDGGDRCYGDADGDGVGVPNLTRDGGDLLCDAPGEAPADAIDDCDDGDATIFPGAAEILCNGIDEDCDGQGGPDEDFDMDGLTWAQENPRGADDCSDDSDGDGVLDGEEYIWGDTDTDSLWDIVDTDDDADGILTIVEGTGEGELDESCDGVGSGPDGVPNYRDTDSDGDFILDIYEPGDANGDGRPDYLVCDECSDPTDPDLDGLCTSLEVQLGTDPNDADSDDDGVPDDIEVSSGPDTDRDGLINALDDDDDDDGVPTSVEAPNGDVARDRDGDGLFDYLDARDWDGVNFDRDADGLVNGDEEVLGTDPADPDSDGDGFSDGVEVGPQPLIAPIDTDDDDRIDALDEDDDNDGIPTRVEGPFDTDGDGVLDPYDLDSDDDGILDADEDAGDTDCDGLVDRIDPDDDGPCAELPPLPTYTRQTCQTGSGPVGWVMLLVVGLIVRRSRRSVRLSKAAR